MIILLSIILVLNILVLVTFMTMFWGAPYVPSSNETVARMMKLAGIKPGQKTVDLGSGDGRVVIAMAQQGAQAHGYDNNPLLVYLARRNIRRAGLAHTAFIHWGNFWKVNYSSFDLVTVYAMPYIMGRLYRKLKKELKPGANILSNAFEFPHQKPVKKDRVLYLYEMAAH